MIFLYHTCMIYHPTKFLGQKRYIQNHHEMKLGKNGNKKGRDFHGKPYQENVTRRRNRKQEYKTKKWKKGKENGGVRKKGIVFLSKILSLFLIPIGYVEGLNRG